MNSTILQHADWSFPVPIKYGPGRLAEIGPLVRASNCHKPLIVTDSGSRDLAFVHSVAQALQNCGLAAAVFSEVAPNPTDNNIRAGCQVFRANHHDSVIAIGGGSGMDAGKAISLVARNNQDIWNFDYDLGVSPELVMADFAPLFCIPTTAGTGAETESTSMLTNVETRKKGCVWHPLQKPTAVILDPELTLGLPASLTAWTGVDAMVHAIEAYCVPGFHPMCDALALKAMRLIHRNLETATNDGSNLYARGAMLSGSCLAGVSFLKGLGLVHAISHMIGAVLDTHHGLTNAILLPAVLRFNQHGIGDKVPSMCQALELPGQDFSSFYQGCTSLLDRLDIPTGLSAIGVTEDHVRDLALKAHTDAARQTNPVAASVEQIEAIIREAICKAR